MVEGVANRLSRTLDLFNFVVELWDADSNEVEERPRRSVGVVTALRLSPSSRSGSTRCAARAFPLQDEMRRQSRWIPSTCTKCNARAYLLHRAELYIQIAVTLMAFATLAPEAAMSS